MHTLSVQHRLIKTYKTERFTTALEAESQGRLQTLNRTFCNGVGGGITGLDTLVTLLLVPCKRRCSVNSGAWLQGLMT